MIKTYVTPGLVCPYCAKKMDRSTETIEGREPNPGDITICVYCAKVSLYGDGLALRKPTEEERLRFVHDPIITRLQIAVAGDWRLKR